MSKQFDDLYGITKAALADQQTKKESPRNKNSGNNLRKSPSIKKSQKSNFNSKTLIVNEVSNESESMPSSLSISGTKLSCSKSIEKHMVDSKDGLNESVIKPKRIDFNTNSGGKSRRMKSEINDSGLVRILNQKSQFMTMLIEKFKGRFGVVYVVFRVDWNDGGWKSEAG